MSYIVEVCLSEIWCCIGEYNDEEDAIRQAWSAHFVPKNVNRNDVRVLRREEEVVFAASNKNED